MRCNLFAVNGIRLRYRDCNFIYFLLNFLLTAFFIAGLYYIIFRFVLFLKGRLLLIIRGRITVFIFM